MDDASVDRASALLRRCGEGLQSATQRAVGAAMGALLQIIGKASDEQIATNPKGGSVRCNLRQASRSSCVDRSSKPAISASTSLRPGFPD
jgi:hypothetical protein